MALQLGLWAPLFRRAGRKQAEGQSEHQNDRDEGKVPNLLCTLRSSHVAGLL